jgi:hypothetical protein
MNPLSHICAPVSVPYRHNVSAVAPVAAVTLDLTGPLNPYAKSSSQEKASSQAQARGRYTANSAAPGFAAQVLVEAGMTGSDPFAGARGAKAYDTRRPPPTTLRLVA